VRFNRNVRFIRNVIKSSSTLTSILPKIGTSMACPGAAGLAALVKEFFERSDLWASVCNSRYKYCQSFSVSGVLTKALLIHSGKQLDLFDGGGDKDRTLGTPPDNFQGWGRINLSNILSVPGINQFDLFVDDLVPIEDESRITYNVEIPSSSSLPLIATISWYDPPTVDGSTQNALIQDLDLIALSPTSKKYYSNNGQCLDNVNNNEKIVVENPEAGVWSIVIKTKSLPYGSQLFSLVVTSGGTVTGVNNNKNSKYENNDILDDIYNDDIGRDDDKK